MRKRERKPQGPVGENKSEIVAELPRACSDERAAVEFVERQRWGDHPACPRCGDLDVAQMKSKSGERNARYLWRCHGCRTQFTVRVGTIMEDSPIPLRHWCYAFWAACAGKKGVSAMQIQRQTGLSYKSALCMMHRIRFAMTPDAAPPKLDGIVEADETYVGGQVSQRSRKKRRRMYDAGQRRMPKRDNKKVPVMALVQRGGDVRAVVVPVVNATNIRDVLLAHIETTALLMTGESMVYRTVDKPFASHEAVNQGLY